MNTASESRQPEGSGLLKLFLSFLCLASMAGAAAAGVMAYQAIDEAKQSLSWPQAPGRITRSTIDVSVHKERTSETDRRHRETRSYSAHIEYEFEVDGTRHTGRRIAVMSDQFGSQGWAQATAKRFPVNTEVTVSYNPSNPDACVLEPGRWGGAGFLIILSAVFGLIPPLVLRAMWSSKPLRTGLHPETRNQRILKGVEIRERILEWEPGQIVHLQRDSISMMSTVWGAFIAGLVLGLLFGLVPALFFFSARGPIFIGQFYLVASLVLAIVCGVWLWLDNRPRETRIEWSSRLIHLAVGSRSTDVGFQDVEQLKVTAPEPKRPTQSGQQPQTHAVRIMMISGGRSYIVAEAECPSGALRHVRSKMTSAARQLAETMSVAFEESQAVRAATT